MQYRVLKLDLHILIVTLRIYFKFQANTFLLVSLIFKFMLKFKNIFKSIDLPSSVTLTLSRHNGNMGSAHPLVGVNN